MADIRHFYKDTTSGVFLIDGNAIPGGKYNMLFYSSDTIVEVVDVTDNSTILGPIEIVNLRKENDAPYTDKADLLADVAELFESGGGGGAGTDAAITASNGLTRTDNDIALGGALVTNTTITLTAADLGILSSADGVNSLVFGTYSEKLGNFASYANLTEIGYYDNVNGYQLVASTDYIALSGTNGVNGSIVRVEDDFIQIASLNGVVITPTNINVFLNGTSRFEYDSDYSANYTDRSLVDKGYVDTAITNTAITANNGLTKTDNDIVLGGQLTSMTTFTGSSGTYGFNFGTTVDRLSDFYVYTSGHVKFFGDNNTEFDITTGDSSRIKLEVGSYGAGIVLLTPNSSLVINSDDAIFTDLRTTKTGIIYAADYSVSFTDRSLVDKEYVDTAVSSTVSKLTRYSNELPTVTDGQAAVSALTNLGTHATVKVVNVEVYLNGAAQAPGVTNDYTLNAATGVITFTNNLSGTDVVLVHYYKQDA
jgi:hypothetical protein